MTVSLVKASDLIPSTGVRVVASTLGMEDGYEGYVSRQVPTNGDDVIVNITKAHRPQDVGARLSYKASSLMVTRRNGKQK